MTSITVPISQQFLASEQICEFENNGFIYVANAFSRGETQEITRWVRDIQDWDEVPGRHMAYYEESLTRSGERVLQRIENFVPYHAGFADFVAESRMLGAVEQLYGTCAVPFKDKINFKLPGGDGYKAHQDQQAGWSAYAPLFITALVTIDEQTIENGCLELAAGHHKKGLVGSEWAPLNDAETATMDFVPYPSRPGDVMYFDSFVPHRSAANRTAKPRRVLYITYNALQYGDRRTQYYADKRRSYPPDIEREPGKHYTFRV